jgi:hypothetical protein
MRTPLLKHCHIVKLKRLLNMLYKPAELAEELGIHADTVYRSYLPAGLPHIRDAHGSIWIHGPAFVEWARQTITQKKAKRQGLPDGHGWCLVCGGPVPMAAPHVRIVNRYLELLQATCPTCGKTVNRARARQISPPPIIGRESGGGS